MFICKPCYNQAPCEYDKPDCYFCKNRKYLIDYKSNCTELHPCVSCFTRYTCVDYKRQHMCERCRDTVKRYNNPNKVQFKKAACGINSKSKNVPLLPL